MTSGFTRALVTGGAGFIGSHLVDALLARNVEVRVLDDLSSGDEANVPSDAELRVGSLTDVRTIQNAIDGVGVVFHLGAHRSVARSVDTPLDTDTANVHGTLVILDAARHAGVGRVVCASSSSVYGGAELIPTPEDAPTIPRSPYAVSKLAGEHYARVFHELYGLETLSLRYFNVFGPRQRPDSPYAAVIPLFIDALRSGRPPTVHGDGEQSRDFTFVSDAVDATIAAASAPAASCAGRVYNVATGNEHSLLQLVEILGRLLGVKPHIEHTVPRDGDVRHTRADPTAAERDLGFRSRVSFEEGLLRTIAAFEDH